MRRSRFQQGSLQLIGRAGSRKAWEYRWYEVQPDGSRVRRNLVLGTLDQLPNETAAQKAVAALRADINAGSPRMNMAPISIQTLVEHYVQKELGEDSSKTYATCTTYEGYFRKWILPRWGQHKLKDVRAVAVEEWLRSVKLSNGSKAKMRNIMHAVFNHAIRWEWHDSNPISQVRQSSKRGKIPVVLNIEEVSGLLQLLKEPARTAAFLAVMTGLRVGELLALRWSDIDFEKGQVSVTRSIVLQRVGDCKTEASRKPVPLDPRLAEALYNWRLISPYPQLDDWVFASPHSNGRYPTGRAPSSGRIFFRRPMSLGSRTLAGTPSDAPMRHFSKLTAKIQNGAGTPATCQQPGDNESLRTSCNANKTRRSEPCCEHVVRQETACVYAAQLSTLLIGL